MKTPYPQTDKDWKRREITDPERDWSYAGKTWVEDYFLSRAHPHRKLIMGAIERLQPRSIFELGCNAGPNLVNISKEYPGILLAGIDPNEDAINYAQLRLPPHTSLDNVSLFDLKVSRPTFDVVLSDAALMYFDPEQIGKALTMLSGMAKRAMILVERQSEKSELTGSVWAHDFENRLKDIGYIVESSPITEEQWPGSPNWVKYGRFIVATK